MCCSLRRIVLMVRLTAPYRGPFTCCLAERATVSSLWASSKWTFVRTPPLRPPPPRLPHPNATGAHLWLPSAKAPRALRRPSQTETPSACDSLLFISPSRMEQSFFFWECHGAFLQPRPRMHPLCTAERTGRNPHRGHPCQRAPGSSPACSMTLCA